MSSEKFYDLLDQEGFVHDVSQVIQKIKDQDNRDEPTDLTGATELVFLHSETHEDYFINLNEIETLEFKLFIGELIIADYLGARWYP